MKMVLAVLWGGAFGFSIFRFATESNWAMVSFIIGIIIAISYLIVWMIDLRYH